MLCQKVTQPSTWLFPANVTQREEHSARFSILGKIHFDKAQNYSFMNLRKHWQSSCSDYFLTSVKLQDEILS